MSQHSADSFKAKGTLTVGDASYDVYRLSAVEGSDRLPYSLKVLLENLLRTEDGANITADHIRALAAWDPQAEPDTEIQFTPARVIMQDFTGVPCIVDLATMREAVAELGGDPARINPLAPAEMVIDHSVIADVFGRADAFEKNVELEYQRNGERYQFLRWGQTAFNDFKVVPPGTGIVHQVNIEHLARVVYERGGVAYPDTCVGTDSHTTMVNGLGVLGWGVGGIEAEAAMLGQPVSMLIPRVVGFKLQRRDPRRGHRDRRRPHDHRDAAQARRRRQVRRVLRRGRRRRAARQPRHHRQHEPRVRFHRSDVPGRRRHLRLPAADRPQRRPRSRSSRPTPRSRGCGTTRPRSRCSPSTSSSTCRRWCRASPGRSGRRTGSRSPTPRRRSARPSATTSPTAPTTTSTRPARSRSRPATRRPTTSSTARRCQRRAAPGAPAARRRRPGRAARWR